jgi:signal transduction histidine kinase
LIGLLLLGLALEMQVHAADRPAWEPLWVAPDGPATSEIARNWINALRSDIEVHSSRCPATAMPPIDETRAIRAYQWRGGTPVNEPQILSLQDPVVSTFIAITRDARGCPSVYYGGRWYPFSQRQFFSPFPNVRLPDTGAGVEVQVLIQDDRLIRPWFRLDPEADFLKQNIYVWMVLSAICAVLIAVLVTMYVLANRSRTVISYSVYVAAFLWWILQEFGISAAFYPEFFSPKAFLNIQCASVAMVALAIGWTMLEFLALKGIARMAIGLGQVASAGAFLGAIWWPTGYRAGSLILVVNATVTMIFLVRHLRGSDLPTKVFTCGFAAAMAGGGVQSLSVVIDAGEVYRFAVFSYALGGFAQVMFWQVAITARLRHERSQLARWRSEELEQQVTQATAELVLKKQIAEDATRSKAAFLAAASHDLRQPTHALGMLIARMGQLPMDANMRQLQSSLNASTRAIQDLLDELMDYSVLDASDQKADLKPIALNQIFSNVRDTAMPLATEKGLLLKFRPTRLIANSDATMLRRMLQNLVTNAIRYTNAGTVFVACRRINGGTRIRIEVWDSGIGIAPDQQSHIFREFYQVGNTARDRQKGIGLGLTIVHRSAELLGHAVELRSNVGCGSRFSILMLQASEAASVDPEVIVEIDENISFVGLELMLIEDDELSRVALTDLLVSWGCSVRAASSGAQAIKYLKTGYVPEIVISDFRLGESRNGIELISDLRALSGYPVPACLISGDFEPHLMNQAKLHQLTLLSKPVRPAKLRNLLRHLLTGRQQKRLRA